jgi:TetR/AcrR family transcriptional regulator, regulator of autoinduction and epiphytic fitness
VTPHPTDAVPRPQRERRHRALVDATRALATEHGANGFTVDQVATLAGVSRRTVFNHFAGLDDLLVAVCEQILAEVTTELLASLDRLTGRTDLIDGRAALGAVCEATRGVDLPTAIVAIHHVLGGPGAADERADAISRTALDHVAGRLRERLHDRAPALDPLDLELTLTLLTAGIATLARHWLETHPDLTPAVHADARADWDGLLDRLLLRLRSGHAHHTDPRVASHG